MKGTVTKSGKRILAAVVAFCIVMGVVGWPVGTKKARAAETFTSGDFTYEMLSDTSVAITGYTGSESVLEIPEAIATEKYENGGIQIIMRKVTYIGSNTFQKCEDLTEITIPSSVTGIGSRAFEYCTNLSEINLPDSVTSIGMGAFRNCTSLSKISIPNSITSIGNEVFWGCTGLMEVNIPNSVVSMGNCVFYDCSGLIKVNMPNSITSMGYSIFHGCIDLTEIDLPSGITSIGFGVFYGCTGLIEINIPDSVTSIGGGAFYGCEGLVGLNLPNSVTSIGHEAFYGCIGLSGIDLPSSITSIEYGVFWDCTSLNEISIPSSVTSIESNAFYGCTSLRKVNIPESVISVGDRAFSECNGLKQVYYDGIQEQWEAISFEEGNKSLQNAVIYFSDGTIQNGFYNGFKYKFLDDVAIEITEYNGSNTIVEVPAEINGIPVTSISYDAFLDNATLQEITIPSSVTKLGALDEGMLGCFGTCPNLKAIHVDTANTEFSSENGVLFNKPKTILVRYPAKKEGAYSIPSGVTYLAETAFEDCANLSGVEIPDSVTGIGYAAFIGCENLESVSFPSNLDMIDDFVFYGCEKLKEIEIPSTVRSIGSYSFEDCISLASITIPVSVEAVGEQAFYGCSSLRDVYYSGIQPQWEQIDIDTSPFEESSNANAQLLNAVIHFSDGTILNGPLDDIPAELADIREELEKLMSGDFLSLEADFLNYLSEGQIDIIKSFLYTWLAEVNYAYKYTGSSEVKELAMKKAGIDPGGDFASGKEQAVTHISVGTKYGPKTFEITLDLGKSDSSGNLYPAYGSMRYEILEKRNIPQNLPTSGLIGNSSYTDMKAFIECVSEASDASLHNTYQWQSLQDEVTAGVLIEKTVAELIGNKNGSFSDGMFTVYAKPLFTYSKTVVITSKIDVNVYIYTMDAKLVGSIVDRQPSIESRTGGAYKARLHAGRKTQEMRQAADSETREAQQAAESETREARQTAESKTREARQTAESKTRETRQTAESKTREAQQAAGGETRDTQQTAGWEDQNVHMVVDGDTRTIYLAGDDYYLQLQGTGTGTMQYEVEETANAEVCRTVQFLELQLEKDMRYDGYVFRPLNLDRDMYALRTQDGSGQDVVYQGQIRYEPGYEPSFKKVQEISISQKNTSLDTDKTIQLDAKYYPLDASNPDLRWITDNESVATVDSNGLVTAVGAGRATITVRTKDGSFLKQYCMIDVAGKSNGPDDNGPDDNSPGSPDNNSKPDGSDGSQPGGSGPGGSSGNFGGGSSGVGGNTGVSGSAAVDREKGPVVVNLHYVVQFDINGGTKLSRKTMTLLADDSPGIMPKAQRKDYTFAGWYTKQDGGTQVTGDKPLGEAATLYARWTKTEAPAAASMTLKAKKKGRMQVSFEKVSGAAGYQIDYSTGKNFASAGTKEAKAAARAKTITGLAAGKKYYVRVRAYVVDSMGNRIYGAYSEVKSVKVKA